MKQIKHFTYSIGTLAIYAFGLLMLNQAQELNKLAQVLATGIIMFAAYLAYELVTTKDYKMLPMLTGIGAMITMIGAMCLYS